ncbi:MAG: hypothetical protein AB8H12_12390 [Lewinella sp.]
MAKYKLVHLDVTAQKSNKIEYLERMVNDASIVLVMAESQYNSFVEKANSFNMLYSEAEADRQTAKSNWNMFLQVKSDLSALTHTANEANLVAVDAFHDIKQLICAWESVTVETLKAAEAITRTANYIQRRKASNQLISDNLVNDAIATSKAAQKTVTLVIKAFTDALNALSFSKQASNTTELTGVFIDEASVALLKKDVEKELKEYKKGGSVSVGLITEIQQSISDKNPLEYTLDSTLRAARTKEKTALNASEAANREMNRAKEEFEQAQTALATWEAALAAAKTAIAG